MKHIYITTMTCLVFFLLISCSDSSTTPHSDMLSTKPESAMLIVKRLDPLHQSDTGFVKSIQDEADVKRLYEKILSLPSFPQTFISCPADNGVEYELTFTLPSQSVSKAIVRATGCQQVTMNEKTYWAMEPKGNGFRALLEHALRLNNDQFSVGFMPETDNPSDDLKMIEKNEEARKRKGDLDLSNLEIVNVEGDLLKSIMTLFAAINKNDDKLRHDLTYDPKYDDAFGDGEFILSFTKMVLDNSRTAAVTDEYDLNKIADDVAIVKITSTRLKKDLTESEGTGDYIFIKDKSDQQWKVYRFQ